MAGARTLVAAISPRLHSSFGLRTLSSHLCPAGLASSSLCLLTPRTVQSLACRHGNHTGRPLQAKGVGRREPLTRKSNSESIFTTQTIKQPQSIAFPTPSFVTHISARLTSTRRRDSVQHEYVYNLPNLLTLSRLLATPAIGALIIHNHHLYAFSLFAYAAVSDLLDGWIARRWHLQTVVGSVVDPMADKLLMTTLVTCLAVNGSLSIPLFALILGRDVSLALSALYYRYASLPAPKTMSRYWDFSLPSAQVHPTTISKLNTFLQLTLLGTLLATNLLHDPSAMSSPAAGLLLSLQHALGGEHGLDLLLHAMSVVVASTTIYSGLEYTSSKNAVVILGGDEALRNKQGMTGRTIMATGFGSFIALAAYLHLTQKDTSEIGAKE